MALDAADWTIATNGDIRWTGAGTATNVTVLEFHRWLQDLADDPVATPATSDLLDITDSTPSDRATDNIITLINGYNIDDTAAQHIFDGSVTQAGGDTTYAGLVVVGSVPSDGDIETTLQIEQNGGIVTNYWGATTLGVGLNGDAGANILLRIMVKTRDDGADIDGRRIRVYAREAPDATNGGHTYAEFSVTMGDGNNTAAIFTSPDLNYTTAIATIAAYDQFSNTEGYQQLTIGGTAYDFYSQWVVTGGGTAPASPTMNDLYEYSKWLTRRGADGSTDPIHGFTAANTPELFRGITHQWNYDAEGGTQPATNEDFSWGSFLSVGVVTGGPYQVGEKVTGDTSGAYGRVLSFDATDTSLVVATESGTWNAAELITGTDSGATSTTDAAIVGQATGGGTARLLAVDDNGTTGTVWVQLLKGTTPGNDAITYESTDHTNVMTVDGSVTPRTLPANFLGTSTGTNIIGGFGIGIDPDDLTSSDLVFDLTNSPIQPPNTVTWTITGLVSGEDRVLVGPRNAGVLDVGQFVLTAAETSGSASIEVSTGTEAPGTGTNSEDDTPSPTGTIRVEGDDGIYYRVAYTGVTIGGSSMTFTGCTGLGDDAALGNNCFISYIDKLATGSQETFSAVYSGTNRDLFVRVRDGGTAGDLEGIKTFETPSSLTDAGGGASAIRTSDA